MDNKKVYIVLLNYNGWEDTIECLESILNNSYSNYQIIVVDNNSPNKSMNYILEWAEGTIQHQSKKNQPYLSSTPARKPLNFVFLTKQESLSISNYPQKETNENPIIFIQSGENNGFASGNNIGIQFALLKNDFDYIWLLNNDTVMMPEALSSLILYAETFQTGITGSCIKYYNSPEKVQAYGGGHINKFLGTGYHIIDKEKISSQLDYITGASFFIKKNVIDSIGLLPEEYFLYYEETDYCFLARSKGFKLGVDINSIIYHKDGSSTKKGSNKDAFSDLLSMNNRILFHKKYLGGGLGLWLGMSMTIFKRLTQGKISTIIKFLQYRKF